MSSPGEAELGEEVAKHPLGEPNDEWLVNGGRIFGECLKTLTFDTDFFLILFMVCVEWW